MSMKCIVVLAVAGLTAAATGGVIGNPADGTTATSLAQDWVHPAFAAQKTWVISDFETAVDNYLYEVVTSGRTTHMQGRDGDGAVFEVWNGLPWEGGSAVLSAANGYETLGSLGTCGADFQGQLLPAGSYYLVYQAVRDFLNTGGMSLVYQTNTGNEDDWQWNPGLGQGWGEYRRVQTAEGVYMDVNWQLTVEPVPEPGALALVAVAGLLLSRRR